MMQATPYSRVLFILSTLLAWLCVHGVTLSQPEAWPPHSSPIPEQLQARIGAAGRPPKITMRGETLRALNVLVPFYERRAFRPVWICDEGMLPHADALVQVIRQAEREGMRSTRYHLSSIERLMVELRQGGPQDLSQRQRAWVDLELLLTDAFFMYGSHVLTGQVDARELQEPWFPERLKVDLQTVLQHALDTNQLVELLQNLRPMYAEYAGLRKALASYQDIAMKGGWPAIPDGPKLKRGDRGSRVAMLRNRLLVTGDLDRAAAPVDDVFDAGLERGLQRFQERHGLDADGVVGPSTLAALNVPAEARVRQIELNMERWRWLPQELGDRYILINIANFALDVVEQGQSVLAMRVVVGKPARRTPFFSAAMTYLVLSPHWYVPPTIAIQDKLPLIRRDPSYAARQNFKLFRDGEGGGIRVNPMSVDWSSVSARNFPYRLRQDPGPRNALGRVKFMLPNRYNVYLHDTPSRALFAKNERAFSSGCIRLEKPIELAEYLLRDDPRWSRQKILASIEKGAEQMVQLPATIPVYLLYWTAWMNDEGIVHFRKDIYDRDRLLDKVLQEAFPFPRGEHKVDMATKRSS